MQANTKPESLLNTVGNTVQVFPSAQLHSSKVQTL